MLGSRANGPRSGSSSGFGRRYGESQVSSLSVVVPVYNGSGSLPDLVRRLEAVLPTLASTYELILVNDASLDDSWTTIERLARDRPWVRGIDLARNYGQHNALLCGIRASRGDVIATMDDDLQHPPEELPRLVARLEEGVDVVYGTPQQERHQVWRILASQVSKIVLKRAMGAETARLISAFRVFRRQGAGAFASYGNPFVNIDVLLSWGARSFDALPVRHESRAVGRSNYTVRMLLRHAVTLLTGFSSLPLRVASVSGFGFMVFGLCVLAYVLVRYLLEDSAAPGFPFLASVIAIFAGAQLFSLGIIGEYLARIHFRSIDRPAYLVRAWAGEPAGPTDGDSL